MRQRIHARRVSRCSICRHLSDYEYADYLRDENAAVPPQVLELKRVMTLGFYYPVLMQCPECGTYYVHNVDCGYMENDVSYERIRDQEATRYLCKKGRRS